MPAMGWWMRKERKTKSPGMLKFGKRTGTCESCFWRLRNLDVLASDETVLRLQSLVDNSYMVPEALAASLGPNWTLKWQEKQFKGRMDGKQGLEFESWSQPKIIHSRDCLPSTVFLYLCVRVKWMCFLSLWNVNSFAVNARFLKKGDFLFVAFPLERLI